jgi:hypothetical protein
VTHVFFKSVCLLCILPISENLTEIQCFCELERSCLFFYLYIKLLALFMLYLYVEYGCQIYQKYILLYEHYKDKNKNLVQMSCTAYIVYTFHLSLQHANFGQFKAKHVHCVIFFIFCVCLFSIEYRRDGDDS